MYDELLANLAILVLSGFVGFAVISKVPNTLHTPLMSGTNAIHGIVVLGAIIVLGSGVDGFLSKLLLVIAVAFVATLLLPELGHDWLLIALGVVIGTIIGVPAARNVKMTQMPQMVALFNGVGGGAVALIAWAEFRQTDGYS